MAEKIVSPGVFTKEIDASFLPAAVGEIGAAVIGPTVKGPAMVPTVVQSYAEYQEKFGDKFLSGSQEYTHLTAMAAKEYLTHAGRLTVVRILDGTYKGANATVLTSGSVAVTGDAYAVGNLTIGSIVGSDASMTFTVSASAGADSIQFIGQPAGSVNTDASDDSVRFFSKGASETEAAANLAAEFNAVSSLSGWTAGNNGAVFQVSGTLAGTQGNGLHVKSGSNEINTAGGTDTAGTEETAFVLNTHAHGNIMNNADTSAQTDNKLLSGSKDNIRWNVSSVNKAKGTFTLDIRRGDDTHKSQQPLETWNNLSLDPKEPNYISKQIGDSVTNIVGAGGSDPFLQMSGSYPNKSKYVYVTGVKDTIDYIDASGNVRDGALSASLPDVTSGSKNGGFEGGDVGYSGTDSLGNVVGTFHPAGGYSYYENISSTNSQGFALSTGADGTNAYTDALSLLSNADEYDINLILIPGVIDSLAGGHSAVVTKAIDVAEARGDCFVVYDTVDYHTTNITNVTTKASERNTNYAATYWPWVQTLDTQTGLMRWVPPSTVLAGIYSFNDKIAAPWFAPAGLNRGGLDTVIQAARKLTHSNRDTLYESNVNPIATFPGQGVCVWGQKTLQKKSSALDRVNVRRLLIKVKKFISASSRFLVFEQNNAQTRERFLNIANPYLEQVQAQSGLNAFKVVMDETNNTPDIVDRNILYGQLFLQPTRTAEFIVLDFTVQPTGAAFPE